MHFDIRILRGALVAAAASFLAACGGSADAPPPLETGVVPTPTVVAPTITQQPADTTIVVGATATFTVAATGTAPLAYQWQRNGTAIAGATGTSYTTPVAAASDSGSTYRAVVSNVVGSVTSRDAVLTVTTTAPVVTISPQPQNLSVAAGGSATFTVGATCSSGTVQFQWQRLGGSVWADVAGATAATYTFVAASTDSGAQFRAVVSCSGQSATPSSAATLTVGTTGQVTLSALPLVGVDDPASVVGAHSIVRLPSGDYVVGISAGGGSLLKRLSADLSSITPFSGVVGQQGAAPVDGPAGSATYGDTLSLAVDAAGVIYVADFDNAVIRRVAGDGSVTTIAGLARQTGATDGSGSAARFTAPLSIALGPDGNLYVTDSYKIRAVTPAGVVTTYAGTGSPGRVDGPASTATFGNMTGIAAAANGDLYVLDSDYARRITRNGSSAGSVVTIAGNGAQTVGVDGTGSAASLFNAHGPAVVGSTLYLLDYNRLRAIDLATNAVTTFSGNTMATDETLIDGPAASALYRGSAGSIAVNPAGGFVIADDGTIRQVSASGTVTTIAANYVTTGREGTAVLRNTTFATVVSAQQAVAADGHGSVYVASGLGNEVRRIDASGQVSIVAGLPSGLQGNVDGVGTGAQFAQAGSAVAVAADGTLFASDRYGIRRIGTDGVVTMYAGSRSQAGAVDGDRSTGRMNVPAAIAIAPNGDLFVAEGLSRIRRVDASGAISTYVGTAQAGLVDGPLASARFSAVKSVAFAPDGTLWVVDNASLRKITPAGEVVTVAGAPVLSGGLAVDQDGTVYGFSSLGLQSVTASGVSTLLVSRGNGLVLGNASPTTGDAISSVALYAPKQLVFFTYSGQGVLVTLP